MGGARNSGERGVTRGRGGVLAGGNFLWTGGYRSLTRDEVLNILKAGM